MHYLKVAIDTFQTHQTKPPKAYNHCQGHAPGVSARPFVGAFLLCERHRVVCCFGASQLGADGGFPAAAAQPVVPVGPGRSGTGSCDLSGSSGHVSTSDSYVPAAAEKQKEEQTE